MCDSRHVTPTYRSVSVIEFRLPNSPGVPTYDMSGPDLLLSCCRLFFPKFVDPSPVSALSTGGISRPLLTARTHCHIIAKDSTGNVVSLNKNICRGGKRPACNEMGFQLSSLGYAW